MASSSSSTPSWKYDVFLSFRGDDTRRNFTDLLHNKLTDFGIITFMDDQLRRGEEISQALLEAIEDSRFSIIVFSQNYASSSWCLDELTKILECVRERKHKAFPVFYELDPSHVRKQRGSYEEAFNKHEEAYKNDKEKVRKWRDALTEASNYSGWDTRTLHHSEVIDEIAIRIFNEIPRKSTIGHMVGMESRINHMLTLLCLESLEVRMVGIWGMGGIGKTTIAHAIYEKIFTQFDGCCFLSNVREKSQRNENLQMELLSQILKGKQLADKIVNVGVDSIRNVLYKKKVLIVLDDVDNRKQLEELVEDHDCFGPKSRIIITTRDRRLLDWKDVNAIYEVQKLHWDEARKLFLQHSFKGNPLKEGFEELCHHFLDHTKGHPLTIKTLGCLLYKKDKEHWNYELERLKKFPNKEVQEVLRISFDGLDANVRKIFLDIACFFKGKNKDYVSTLLKSCELCPETGMSTLMERGLVTISLNDKLDMHDLIQEMGWEIVREQSNEDLSKQSRLWVNDDVEKVLTSNTGGEGIEVIILDLSASENLLDFNASVFTRMEKLRILEFRVLPRHYFEGEELDVPSKIHLTGDLKFLSNNLRYLRWDKYPLKSLPPNFYPRKLFKWKMRLSRLEQLWEGKKWLSKLRCLDLSHSRDLIRTPDLSGAPELMEIHLEGCTSLVKVHASIENLTNLSFLNLKNCSKLQEVAKSFCKLTSLASAFFSSCSELRTLPDDLRMSYQVLDLSGCLKLEELPKSIVELKSVKTLNLSGCAKLKKMPDVIGRSLETLNLFGCSNLKELLKGIGQSLHHLILSECNLQEGALPTDMSCLRTLEYLDLSGNGFITLPSLTPLNHLDILKLKSCKSLRSLTELPSCIKRVLASNCESLETISRPPKAYAHALFDFSNCVRLVENEEESVSLKAILGGIRALPPRYSNWFLREKIGFNALVPGSRIPNPEWFSLPITGNSIILKLPPNVRNLQHGDTLAMGYCAVLGENPSRWHHDHLWLGAAMLGDVVGPTDSHLKLSFSGYDGKAPLVVKECAIRLLLHRECFGPLMIDNEEEFDAVNTTVFSPSSTFDGARWCKTILEPHYCEPILQDYYVEEHQYKFGELSVKCRYNLCEECMTKEHTLRFCIEVRGYCNNDHVTPFKSYKEHSKELISTPDFSQDIELREINVEGCTSLVKVHPSIENLENLNFLNLKNCSKLEEIAKSFRKLMFLKKVDFSGCSELRKLPNELRMSSPNLDLSGCSKLEELPKSIVESLKTLNLFGCAKLKKLPDDIGTSLQTLNLCGCSNLEELPKGIRWSLHHLNLSECNLKEGALPNDMSCLRTLEYLDLSGNSFITLPSLTPLRYLKILKLKSCKSLRSLTEIPECIEMAVASNCESLETFSCPPKAYAHFDFSNCGGLVENEEESVSLKAILRGIRALPPRKSNGFLRAKNLFNALVPGSRIPNPEWFSLPITGNSIILKLPPNFLDLQHGDALAMGYCAVLGENPSRWHHDHLWLGVAMLSDDHLTTKPVSHLKLSFSGYDGKGPLVVKECAIRLLLHRESFGPLIVDNEEEFDTLNTVVFSPSSVFYEAYRPRTLEPHYCEPILRDYYVEKHQCKFGEPTAEWQYYFREECMAKVHTLRFCIEARDCYNYMNDHVTPYESYMEHSKELISTPDFSQDIELREINVEGCTSLVKVHPSIENLENLNFLNLKNCSKLEEIAKSFRKLMFLKKVDFSGCSELRKLPNELRMSSPDLDLSGCSKLEELPKSIVESLKTLNLSGCSKLKKLPDDIGTSLQILNLSSCSNLEELPKGIDKLTSLKTLNLFGCSNLEELPKCFDKLMSLKALSLFGCTKLKKWPDDIQIQKLVADGSGMPNVRYSPSLLANLEVLSLKGCKGLGSSLPSLGLRCPSLGLWSLSCLNLSDCNLQEGALPSDMSCLLRLKYLDLSGNSFITLPSLTPLYDLYILKLDSCKSLQSLTELPNDIKMVVASNCESLETFSRPPNAFAEYRFDFSNCGRLVENEDSLKAILGGIQAIIPPRYSNESLEGKRFNALILGSRIPNPDLTNRSVGNSIILKLPPNFYHVHALAMGYCAVLGENPSRWHSDHLWLGFAHLGDILSKTSLEPVSHLKLSFSVYDGRAPLVVKECGIRLSHVPVQFHYEEESDDYEDVIESDTEEVIESDEEFDTVDATVFSASPSFDGECCCTATLEDYLDEYWCGLSEECMADVHILRLCIEVKGYNIYAPEHIQVTSPTQDPNPSEIELKERVALTGKRKRKGGVLGGKQKIQRASGVWEAAEDGHCEGEEEEKEEEDEVVGGGVGAKEVGVDGRDFAAGENESEAEVAEDE